MSDVRVGYTQDEAGNVAGLYLDDEDRSTHIYVIGSSGVRGVVRRSQGLEF